MFCARALTVSPDHGICCNTPTPENVIGAFAGSSSSLSSRFLFAFRFSLSLFSSFSQEAKWLGTDERQHHHWKALRSTCHTGAHRIYGKANPTASRRGVIWQHQLYEYHDFFPRTTDGQASGLPQKTDNAPTLPVEAEKPLQQSVASVISTFSVNAKRQMAARLLRLRKGVLDEAISGSIILRRS